VTDDFFGEEWTRSTIDRVARDIRPEYFTSKRWFGSKSRTIQGCRVVDIALLRAESGVAGLLLLEISYAASEPEWYHVPLAFKAAHAVPAVIKDQPDGVAIVMQTPHGEVWGYDAFAEDAFCAALYQGMYDDTRLRAREHGLIFHRVPGRLDTRDVHTIKRINGEQSNTSIVYDDTFILKAFRKLSAGLNPDFEIPYFLTTHTDFRYVPKVAGFFEYDAGGADDGETILLGVLQDFVVNDGDGYTNALSLLRAYFADVSRFIAERPDYTAQEQADQTLRWTGTMRAAVQRLGYITGLMHNALASNAEAPDFRPEPITRGDAEHWEADIAGLIERVIQVAPDRIGRLPDDQRELLRPVLDNRPAFLTMVDGLHSLAEEACHKIRYHGDYHLGQVLRTGDDFVILDFEGEPARGLAERRAKHCPLKDVAGLLRSFNYAAYAALFNVCEERQADEQERAALERWALSWEGVARTAYLEGYREATGRHSGPRFVPSDSAAFQRVIRLFEVEKAFYELNYEFNNRPTWVPIPAKGLLRLLRGRE